MIKLIKRPDNLSPEDARIQQAIILISGVSVIANSILAVATFAGSRGQALVYISSGLSFLLILLLTLAGFIWIGRLLIPSIALLGVGYLNMIGNGLHDPIMIGYGGVVIVAALMLGELGTIAFGLLAALVVLGIGMAGRTGVLPHPPASPTELIIAPVAVFGVSMLLWIVIRQLHQSLRISRQNEQAQVQANTELTELKTSLERRVEDRTSEIEKASKKLSQRATQLQTITELSESIAQLQDLNKLLPATTRLISERFGFYHIGIFLMDQDRQYAVLQAANSEGGERMLKRNHRLRLGIGVVGYCAKMGQPRIALDVGADAVFFNNPDLPETRSETALPLKSRNKTVGVLDIQSKEANAFSTEDLEVLTALANQVSIALENTRLLTETRAALAQVQEVYNAFTHAEWSRTIAQTAQPGFRYQNDRIEMLENTLQDPEVLSAVQTGEVVADRANRSGERRATIAVPVKLRGEVIGILHIESNDPAKEWLEDELSLVQAVAERAAFAMENARLFQDARRRAAKERLISEATARISSAFNVENILQATAEELERVLGGSEISIQFQSKE
jgi:GAF domain-containing protein